MTQAISYEPRKAGVSDPQGPLLILLRVAGPFAWGGAALFLLVVGIFTLALLLPGVAAAGATWAWLALLLMTSLLGARTMRAVRRSRGMLVLAWVDAAVRLNLPLHAFLIAAAQGERGRVKKRLERVAVDISTGVPLGTVLARQVREIPDRATSRLAAAEKVGQLAPTLRRIVEQEGFGSTARSKGSALFRGLYPAIVLLTGLYVAGFLLIFIVPKFREIFRDFNVSLPPMTERLLTVSNFVANGPIASLLAPLLLLLMLLYVLGRALREFFTPWWPRTTPRWALDTLVWCTPFLRTLARDRALADVCAYLGDALRAGLPLPLALGDAGQIQMNRHVQQKLAKWRDLSLAGIAPAPAARAAGFPSVLTGFMDAGVHNAGLPEAFDFLSRYYRARHARLVAVLTDASEPLITLLIALLVGAVAYSLFQPIVTLINAVMEPQWSNVL
jgi:type II secretory pathway component PulF